MSTVSGYPYFEIEFSKDGSIVAADQILQVKNFLKGQAGSRTTDVLLFSHGWNNDESEARDLYQRFLAVLASEAAKRSKQYDCAFVGLMWPSKKFADASLIPGGAAGINDANVDSALELQHQRLIDTLEPDAAARVKDAATLIAQLNSVEGRKAWIACLRSAIQGPAETEDGGKTFFSIGPEELFERLKVPTPPPATSASGGGGAGLNPVGVATTAPAQGEASGFGAMLSGIKGAALRILNYTTYYIMKNRAGVAGQLGLKPALQEIQASCSPEIRYHLLGHSFGARLVTAATSGAPRVKVQTLTLLQGAYSHYGMATNYDGKNSDGLFRDIVAEQRVVGPILISHSVHDLPVGIAYAIASRFAGQVGAGLGGPNDPFGGLGRNGAQKTDNSQFLKLMASGTNYSFKSHVANNLNGDAVISGHSDICKPEIAHAFLSALAAE
jgi:hypothetical protein